MRQSIAIWIPHRSPSRCCHMCANDDIAIVWTKQLIDGYDVELWSSDRFVIRFDHQER